jgi:integration host factor subunit alpha
MIKDDAPETTLTRADLRDAVYRACPELSREGAKKILDDILEEISEALIRGEHVKIRGVGNFKVRSKRERVGRNPKTGVEAKICPRRVISFKASQSWVDLLSGKA